MQNMNDQIETLRSLYDERGQVVIALRNALQRQGDAVDALQNSIQGQAEMVEALRNTVLTHGYRHERIEFWAQELQPNVGNEKLLFFKYMFSLNHSSEFTDQLWLHILRAVISVDFKQQPEFNWRNSKWRWHLKIEWKGKENV